MAPIRIPVILAMSLLLMMAFYPLLVQERSGVEAWTDGNDDSPVYPHYGIVDMLVDQAYREFNETYPEKAEFLRYWYLWDGADSEADSFDTRDKIATPDDNFLAWTDDDAVNDGDKANYFIHNRKGWEITDAPTTAQMWANWTIQNLTRWFMEGKPTVSDAKHRAAYCAARMSRYISKMSEYCRTDYSQWDQVNSLPDYDPNEVSYQKYYEAYLWTDNSMTELVRDFRNRTFELPLDLNATKVHIHTSDVAKFVNSRDGSAVTMVDNDASVITVGKTYKEMLDQFMYCWDNNVQYNGTVRGFNDTLWGLTLENMVAVTENLSAIYAVLYDYAETRFMETSPDVTIVDHSFEPQDVLANDMVTVNVTVKNTGPTSTRGAIIIELSTSTAFVNTRPVALQAFEQKNLTFTAFRAGTSEITVTLKADSQEILAESDEMDNEMIFNITPGAEIFSSDLEIAEPFTRIRRDTIQPIMLLIRNTGNRQDGFTITGVTTTPNVYFVPPDVPVMVEPFSILVTKLLMVTVPETDLGQVVVDITAEGGRSVSDVQINVEVLDRSQDPIPSVSGLDWVRIGDNITLSAAGSTDPDGDSLYFTWRVPEWGNYTGPEVTFNYSREGTYDIVLEVYDGNLTVEFIWTVNVYPHPLHNLSSRIVGRDVSSVQVAWNAWKAGGLIAYWLEASALPGQGETSERGPFVTRVEPGVTSGRVGKFHPGTNIEVKIRAQCEVDGNLTMDTLLSNTTGRSGYQTSIHMYIELNEEGPYLYLQYKPWTTSEGRREPDMVIERWSGGFVELPAETMEHVQSTNTKDTVKFPLKADWGLYRATLTYFFENETVSSFEVAADYEKANNPPEITSTNLDQKWELNVNGTCTMHVVLEVVDKNDHLTVEADWGDGNTSIHTFSTSEAPSMQMDIYHDYTEIGQYSISLKMIDWSGAVVWVNETVEVHEYSPPNKYDGPSIVIMIIIAIVATIFIVGMLIFLGRAAYRFAKKDTEVEFDMDKLKSRKGEKVGTGTDFDKRREMQIPKESIMGAVIKEKQKEDLSREEATLQSKNVPLVKGSIVFDDEE